jgi:4-hydroxybenzoate polyprenyltransferase
MSRLAGGDVPTAARLSAAMIAIQFAIGALNDAIDAPDDLGRTPPKPVSEGLVSVSAARRLAIASASVGLLLVVPSGLPTIVIAGLGLACGVAYDLGLSRTTLSWLPLVLALPLVPVFAWQGTAGRVPEAMLAVLPIAMLAGGGLAVGNGLVDLESDRRIGRLTVAAAFGRSRAWVAHAAALAGAAIIVLAFLPRRDGATILTALVGAMLIGTGIAGSRLTAPAARRLAWQVEAAGTAVLGVAWILAASEQP